MRCPHGCAGEAVGKLAPARGRVVSDCKVNVISLMKERMSGKVIVIVGAAVIGMFVCGCRSSRVMEAETVRDTVVRFRSDTVVRERVRVEWRERVRHDSVIVREDSAGRVIYKEIWRTMQRAEAVEASKSEYKSRVDSAVRAKVETREVVKEKKGRGRGYGWCVGAGCLIGIVAVVGLARIAKQTQ